MADNNTGGVNPNLQPMQFGGPDASKMAVGAGQRPPGPQFSEVAGTAPLKGDAL